jgi:hypothetical protein
VALGSHAPVREDTDQPVGAQFANGESLLTAKQAHQQLGSAAGHGHMGSQLSCEYCRCMTKGSLPGEKALAQSSVSSAHFVSLGHSAG